MIIIIKNSVEKNLYDSTHSYVVDNDFWSNFSNHVFFGIFSFNFCIGFDDIERDIKRRPFCNKTREFGVPRGGYSGHPSNFDMQVQRLAIFYKPSWGMFLETKVFIIIKNSRDLNLYNSMHSYVVDSDFWSDFSNHVFFGIFVSVSMISKEILKVAHFLQN